MKKILLSLLVVGIMVSCSNDDEPSPNSNETELIGGEFLPLNSGSTWKYYSELLDESSTTTATGKTKEIDGNIYFERITTGKQIGTRTEYNFVENGEYYTVGNLAGTEISLLYLKESAELGDTWAQEETLDNGAILKYDFEMIEKGISHEVQGETFTNVFNVKYVNITVFNGLEIPTVEQNIYFSKGIGIIQYDFGGSTNDLISYEIK
jgi:hypothetical protein